MTSRDYFKGKRVAVIGLGYQNEMVEDLKYLIKAGALVSIYDLKSEARLKSSLVQLRTQGLANYVCGQIPADDLLDMDLIVLSHEYPLDSTFLKGVQSRNEVFKKNEGSRADRAKIKETSNLILERFVPIEYPETLFFKLAPPVTLVGVIGACGKSTVFSMLSPMLERACRSIDDQGYFELNFEDGSGILCHLKKIKNGDVVLLKMSPEIQKELYGMRISPSVAIFVTLPASGSYETSPFEILSYQTYNNFIIAPDEIIDLMRSRQVQVKAKILRTKASIVPLGWKLNGWVATNDSHDRENAALALQAARLFKLSDEDAERLLVKWKTLKGRLELVKKTKTLEFYNDGASVSAESTENAIRTLSVGKNVILIFGGAGGKSDYRALYSILLTQVKSLVLVPGSGTLRERVVLNRFREDGLVLYSAPSLEEAVRLAVENSARGDRILFSPGFEAAGLDSSRAERAERFLRAVRGL
ncbi:MAG: cyanophycin synthetase [Candidatus Paceibacterota bacterium]